MGQVLALQAAKEGMRNPKGVDGTFVVEMKIRKMNCLVTEGILIA